MPTINDAINYIKQGLYVFPLPPNSKEPYANTKGLNDATNSEMTLRKIWRDDSNIGINCGMSGLVGFNVDPRHRGPDSLSTIITDFGAADLFEKAPISATPGHGNHYWLGQPKNGEPIKCPLFGLPGIDIKGVGGYLLAPPSHYKGPDYEGDYSWVKDGAIQPFPVAILQRYPYVSRGRSKADGPISAPSSSLSRNIDLTSLAGTLFNAGFKDDRLYQMLCKANELLYASPLPETEIAHVVRSAEDWQKRFYNTTGLLEDWRNHGVTGKAFELLYIIARSANTITGEWSPNRSQLMDELGTNRTHTLYDARAILVELGAITLKEHPFYLNLSTTYKLHWPGESRAPQNGKSCPPIAWN